VRQLAIQLSRPVAYARLRGSGDAAGLSGVVKFYQQPGGVVVEANIFGLPYNGSGIYGFHIHEGAVCAGPSFLSAGGHYNPKALSHPLHAGDLPPLLSCGGRAYMAVMTDRFSIREILGRTVVIHGMPDDFVSQPGGNAGDRIACGAIEPVGNRAAIRR